MGGKIAAAVPGSVNIDPRGVNSPPDPSSKELMLEVPALVVKTFAPAVITQHVAMPDDGDLDVITERVLSAFTVYEDTEPVPASDINNAPDGAKVAPNGSTPSDVLTKGLVSEPSPVTENTSILFV